MTPMFYNLGSPYLTCLSDVQETCNAPLLRRRNNVANEEECKQFCNRVNNCNFVFFTAGKDCLLYNTCDKKRSTTNVGTIYGKSVCPGKQLFTEK